MTARETAILALLALVRTALPLASVIRNADAAEEVATDGTVIVRDGDTVDEEAILSPLSYGITHQSEVELFAADETARDAMIEALTDAIATNRTLSGAVEWTAALSPQLDVVSNDGSSGVFVALLSVNMNWTVVGDPSG